MHLLEINVPSKITFHESDALASGSALCTFEVDSCKIGIAICADIKFPELANLYQQAGSSLHFGSVKLILIIALFTVLF